MRNRKARLNTLFKRIPWTEGMALTRSKKKALDGGHSLGDGNCAFNAFALAFCRPDILDKVESQQEPDTAFKNFIEKVAKAFNIENNWQSVKQRLLELDKTTLQRKLAPILRELAIEQAKCDNQNRDEMFHSLYSTYRHYIYKMEKLVVSQEQDDIYNAHPFIVKRFEAFYQTLIEIFNNRNHDFFTNKKQYNKLMRKQNRTEDDNRTIFEFDQKMDGYLMDDLRTWWKGEGYHTFFDHMEKNGKWAGDLELKQLGQYFNIPIVCCNPPYYHIHLAYGTIPRLYNKDDNHGLPEFELQEEDINQLVVRHIIDVPSKEQKQLSLLSSTELEINARLAAVPEYDEVSAFIDKNKAEAVLEKQTVPSTWSVGCVHELIKRDIVDNKTKQFIVTSDEAKKRITGMKHHEALSMVWKLCYRHSVPVIKLTNPDIHWDIVDADPVAVSTESTLTTIAHPDHAAVSTEPTLTTIAHVDHHAAASAETTKKAHLPYEKSKLYTDTLKMFSKWDTNKVKSISWNKLTQDVDKLVQDIKQEDATIEYSIADANTGRTTIKKVSPEMQCNLDRALAEKLQLEEYEKFKKFSRK